MTLPGNVHRYALTIGAAGAVVASTIALGWGGAELDLVTAALFGAVVLAAWAPLRFQHRGGTQGFTLDEAILVAMLFALPSGAPPLVHALGVLTAHVALRSGVVKSAFNAGQVALAAGAAAVVFTFVAPPPEVMALRSIGAAVLATAAYNVVNTAATAELFRRLEGRARGETIRSVWRLNIMTWAGNTSFGLLLAFVVLEDPIAAVLAVTLMAGLYLGYRGYARAMEERERAEMLHTVTRTLADATASDESVCRFLEATAALFGGEAAEMVYVGPGVSERFTWHDGRLERHPADPDEALDDRLVGAMITSGVPRYIAPSGPSEMHDALVSAGHRDAIMAPLSHEGRTLGMLAVYDRHGLEPWSETDATFLGSIAHEAAIAVRNAELFESVRREKSKLAEETQKLRDVIASASDGIAYIDEDGVVATWNPGMVDITGITAEEAEGRPWFMALRIRDERDEIPIEGDGPVGRALAGSPTVEPVDLEVLRRDGEWRWVRCGVSPVVRRDGTVTGVVLVARDVTRERELDEMKADFIATVSHELRTPLTPLRGWVDMALERIDGLDPDQLHLMFSSMQRQVTRLDRLVADLLLVAEVDRGTLTAQMAIVPVRALLDEVLGSEEVQAASERITLEGDLDVHAITDIRAATRIVRAIVDNALKHTDGPILIETRREAGEVVVSVADKGPGIPRGDQGRIYERFSRLGDHLTRTTRGSGLGLFLARGLAEQISARIELDSWLGEGSVFRLVLPGASKAPSGETSPSSGSISLD